MTTNNHAYDFYRSIVDQEIQTIACSACLSTAIESTSDETIRKTFESGMAWLEGFIMQPHADLGRRGAVCPFARPVHTEKSLAFCVWDTNRLPFNDFLCVIRSFPELYFQLRDRMGGNSKLFSICVFVRGIEAAQYSQYIDEAHALTKPAFMEAGLMLGEFHPLSQTKGAHSERFNPMRSTHDALVVRAISAHDILFIDRAGSPTQVRLRELTHYRRWVGDTLPEEERERIRHRIAELKSVTAGRR